MVTAGTGDMWGDALKGNAPAHVLQLPFRDLGLPRVEGATGLPHSAWQACRHPEVPFVAPAEESVPLAATTPVSLAHKDL